MTNEEAKHKLVFLKKAYQKLIDEKVDSGKLVGDGVRGEWEAETPLDEVYKDMIESLDFAIKALEQQPVLDTRQRERQLEMEYQHGYDKGWEEGRKTLEQQPSEETSPSNTWVKIGEHIGEIMNLLFEDTTEMTTEEAIDQLASMRCHAEDMRDPEDEKCVWTKDIQAICMAIEALKKQPKPGAWVMIGTIGLGYKCSNCGSINTKRTNFCPECGAMMEEEG